MYRNISDDCPVDHVGVVVSVNDEEQLLGQCLEALCVAAHRVAVPVTVSRRSSKSEKSVRRARAAGMTELLRRHHRAGTWLATTDGDSTVPPHWLTTQVRLAEAGARVIAGTVTVADWKGRSDMVRVRPAYSANASALRIIRDGFR